jgi:hypothetical protein
VAVVILHVHKYEKREKKKEENLMMEYVDVKWILTHDSKA